MTSKEVFFHLPVFRNWIAAKIITLRSGKKEETEFEFIISDKDERKKIARFAICTHMQSVESKQRVVVEIRLRIFAAVCIRRKN